MSGYPTANTAPAIKPLVYTLPYSAFSSGTTAYTLNLGSPPPSGAYLSAFQLTVPAEWTHSGGTSAITMDLGWVGNPTALAAGIDVLDSSSINITGPSAGVSGGTATDQYDVGGKQLTIRITTTGGNTNTLTGGSVTVSVWVVQQLANLPFVAEFVANIGGGPTPINQLGATTVDITNITHDAELHEAKAKTKSRSSAKAYSYISSVDGKVMTHKTWSECEARVRGKKARFKKATSPSEEQDIIRSFSS